MPQQRHLRRRLQRSACCQHEGSVVSIGVDSDDVEIAALRDGFLSAIIVQDAFTQGYKCMENAILTLVNGQNPETSKQVNCPPVVVNMENIDSEKIQFMMSPYVK